MAVSVDASRRVYGAREGAGGGGAGDGVGGVGDDEVNCTA